MKIHDQYDAATSSVREIAQRFLFLRNMVLSAMAGAAVSTFAAPADLDYSNLFPESVKCIYLVAPASHLDNKVVATFTNALVRTNPKLKVKVSDGVWHHETDAAKRARHLEEAWTDPETDLILCVRGGTGAFGTLRELNFEKLKSRDVPFMGFSNISILLNGFVKMGVKHPIGGPTVSSLATYPNTKESILRARSTLERGDLTSTRLSVRRAPLSAITGKPIGGHISSLVSMPPEWMPDTTGRIVFLEINKSRTLDDAIEHFGKLKAKGWFDNAAAIVLCDMGIKGKPEEKEELRRHITESVTCPVFSGYQFGHIPDLFAIDFDRTLTITPDGLLAWESFGNGY